MPLPRALPHINGTHHAGVSPPRAAARPPLAEGDGRDLRDAVPRQSPAKDDDPQSITLDTPQWMGDWGGAYSRDSDQVEHTGPKHLGEDGAGAPQAHTHSAANEVGERHAAEGQGQYPDSQESVRQVSFDTSAGFKGSVGKRNKPAIIPPSLQTENVTRSRKKGSPTEEQIDDFITSTLAIRIKDDAEEGSKQPVSNSLKKRFTSMFLGVKMTPNTVTPTPPDGPRLRPQLCGRMPFTTQRKGHKCDTDVAKYLRVNKDMFNMHLLRYYVDNVRAVLHEPCPPALSHMHHLC